MARGTRARKKQEEDKKKRKPPQLPEGETFDGELGTMELEIPRAIDVKLRRAAIRRALRRHIGNA